MSAKDLETINKYINEYEKTHPKTKTDDQDLAFTVIDAANNKQSWARYGMGLVLTDKDLRTILSNTRFKSEEDFLDSFKYIQILREMKMTLLQQKPGSTEGLAFRPFTSNEEEHPQKMVIVWAKHQPEPFSAAYQCFEELRDEMRTAAERYLPEGFDWDSHIGYVTYTVLK